MGDGTTGSEVDAGKKKPNAPRASFPVTDDGRVDLSKASEDTKDRLRKMMNDPELISALSGAGNGPEPARVLPFSQGNSPTTQVVIGNDMAGALWGAAGRLLANLAVGRGYQPDHATRAMMFTAAEIGELAPPTAAVLNKYLAKAGATKYGEEINLLLAVGAVVGTKIAILNALASGQTFPGVDPFPIPPNAQPS